MDNHDYPPPTPDAIPVTQPVCDSAVDAPDTAPVTAGTAEPEPVTGDESPQATGVAEATRPALRGRLPLVVAAVSVVIALIAVGIAVVAMYRLNQVTANATANAAIAAAAADELRDSVGALRNDLTELAASNDGSDLAAVTNRIEGLELRNTILAQCVNEYMDVIGRWSSTVNSSFRWNYC